MHLKMCLTSFTIWKIQIKTALTLYFTPDKIATIKKTNTGKGMGKDQPLYTVGLNANLRNNCGSQYGGLSKLYN